MTCPVLRVSNADFANSNGDYSVTEERVAWSADRPVYANADKDRYLPPCHADLHPYHVSQVHLLECWRTGLVHRQEGVPQLRQPLAQE